MLGPWPSLEEIGELGRMPHAWHEANAAEAARKHPYWLGVSGLEVPTIGGRFGILASAKGVAGVLFPGFDAWEVAGRMERGGFAYASSGKRRVVEAGLELMGYLLGEVHALATPVDLSTLTPFRQDVYGALREVPYGETVTYGELARRAGCPTKARAVGGAMHANPIPVFVPCHRVLAAGGALGGWSGPDGWKETLLALEGATPRAQPAIGGGRGDKSDKRPLQSRRTR